MLKIEKLLLTCILGAIAPISGFLAGWWGTFWFLPAALVAVAAGAGLILGLVVDAFFLKKWVNHAPGIDLRIWMVIYLFYSVAVFGFFMGVPVFNLLLGMPAGYLMGRRLVISRADEEQINQLGRWTQVFTTAVLGLFCLASAALALRDPSTGANLRGMLGLGFEVTTPMIWGIILIGGGLLLALEWVLTEIAMQIAVKPGYEEQ